MGLPAPEDPTPDSPSSSDRADWLVGAEEGLAWEVERRESADAAPRPTLRRPTLPGSGPGEAAEILPLPPPKPRPVGVVRPSPDAGPDFVQGPAMTWEPGARSVPSLRPGDANAAAAGRGPAPANRREFPSDDVVERSRARTEEIEAALRDVVEGPRPHEVVSPDAFGGPPPALPWHLEAVNALRTDRRIQVLIGLVVVALAAVALWPRGEVPVSLAGLRKHAAHFDGERVHVSGRVGQVFPVGGGFAYYLLQGNDTLVVFTRSRTPVERQRVSVTGTMSNGSLDGQPTLALFEDPDETK